MKYGLRGGGAPKYNSRKMTDKGQRTKRNCEEGGGFTSAGPAGTACCLLYRWPNGMQAEVLWYAVLVTGGNLLQACSIPCLKPLQAQCF